MDVAAHIPPGLSGVLPPTMLQMIARDGALWMDLPRIGRTKVTLAMLQSMHESTLRLLSASFAKAFPELHTASQVAVTSTATSPTKAAGLYSPTKSDIGTPSSSNAHYLSSPSFARSPQQPYMLDMFDTFASRLPIPRWGASEPQTGVHAGVSFPSAASSSGGAGSNGALDPGLGVLVAPRALFVDADGNEGPLTADTATVLETRLGTWERVLLEPTLRSLAGSAKITLALQRLRLVELEQAFIAFSSELSNLMSENDRLRAANDELREDNARLTKDRDEARAVPPAAAPAQPLAAAVVAPTAVSKPAVPAVPASSLPSQVAKPALPATIAKPAALQSRRALFEKAAVSGPVGEPTTAAAVPDQTAGPAAPAAVIAPATANALVTEQALAPTGQSGDPVASSSAAAAEPVASSNATADSTSSASSSAAGAATSERPVLQPAGARPSMLQRAPGRNLLAAVTARRASEGPRVEIAGSDGTSTASADALISPTSELSPLSPDQPAPHGSGAEVANAGTRQRTESFLSDSSATTATAADAQLSQPAASSLSAAIHSILSSDVGRVWRKLEKAVARDDLDKVEKYMDRLLAFNVPMEEIELRVIGFENGSSYRHMLEVEWHQQRDGKQVAAHAPGLKRGDISQMSATSAVGDANVVATEARQVASQAPVAAPVAAAAVSTTQPAAASGPSIDVAAVPATSTTQAAPAPLASPMTPSDAAPASSSTVLRPSPLKPAKPAGPPPTAAAPAQPAAVPAVVATAPAVVDAVVPVTAAAPTAIAAASSLLPVAVAPPAKPAIRKPAGPPPAPAAVPAAVAPSVPAVVTPASPAVPATIDAASGTAVPAALNVTVPAASTPSASLEMTPSATATPPGAPSRRRAAPAPPPPVSSGAVSTVVEPPVQVAVVPAQVVEQATATQAVQAPSVVQAPAQPARSHGPPAPPVRTRPAAPPPPPAVQHVQGSTTGATTAAAAAEPLAVVEGTPSSPLVPAPRPRPTPPAPGPAAAAASSTPPPAPASRASPAPPPPVLQVLVPLSQAAPATSAGPPAPPAAARRAAPPPPAK